MRTKICDILQATDKEKWIGKKVHLAGWVRSVRSQKTFSFIELNDGSTFPSLQLVADVSTVKNYETLLPTITTGSSVKAQGTIVESKGAKQPLEVLVNSITLLGEADPASYPLQKKRHSFEFLRTIAHLRPRTNTQRAVAKVRNSLAYATHKFFQERNFFYLHTPIITGLDCEGGGDLFRVTTLENLPQTADKKADYEEDFFKKAAYLTVSGQLNAEIYACALSDVYTFGPTFRAENSNTSRHLAEFWMIEPEMAFCDLQDDMEVAEKYLQYLISTVLTECSDEMVFFDSFISKGIIQRMESLSKSAFERISYTEAIQILQNCKESFVFPVKWGLDLQSEHERFLAEKHCKKPVFIYDYPKEIKAFYMRDNDDNKTVAAMDLLVEGVGELIGGSQREERLVVLERKMKEHNLDPEQYWWYVELRKYGTVPHAGFGLGFERLVQLVTGLENIRDIIPFPRYPAHLDF